MARRKKYESVPELEKAIDEFFEECEQNNEPPTIQGLALAIGYNSRQSLLNLEGYGEEFLDTIKTAKLRIEKAKVVGGMKGVLNPAIVIFDLKNNHGYKDRHEIEADVSLTKKPAWFDDSDYQTKAGDEKLHDLL